MIVNLLANKLNPCSTFSLNLSQSEARPAQNNLKAFQLLIATLPQDQYDLTMNVETLAPLMIVKLLYRPLVRSWNNSSSPLLFSFSSTSKPIIMIVSWSRIRINDHGSRIRIQNPMSLISVSCDSYPYILFFIWHIYNTLYPQHSLQGSLEFLERTFSPGNLQSPGGSRRCDIMIAKLLS